MSNAQYDRISCALNEVVTVLNEGMKVWFLRSRYNSSRSGTVCNDLWDQHTPHISR